MARKNFQRPKRGHVSTTYSIRGDIDNEIQLMNEEYVWKHQINRSHILEHQPWVSKSIPIEYLPDRSKNWFPPVMHLGIALTSEEAKHFARERGIASERGRHFALQKHLSIACDVDRPGTRIQAIRCDSLQYPIMYALVSNYNLRPNLNAPFEKMVTIVREVFGPMRDVMWWLDLAMNHDPENYFVSDPPCGNFSRYGW